MVLKQRPTLFQRRFWLEGLRKSTIRLWSNIWCTGIGELRVKQLRFFLKISRLSTHSSSLEDKAEVKGERLIWGFHLYCIFHIFEHFLCFVIISYHLLLCVSRSWLGSFADWPVCGGKTVRGSYRIRCLVKGESSLSINENISFPHFSL